MGKADLIDNDRGLTTDHRRGFVKVVADGDGVLLGGVMVGPRAGEVMHELALAVQLGAKAADVARTRPRLPNVLRGARRRLRRGKAVSLTRRSWLRRHSAPRLAPRTLVIADISVDEGAEGS